MSTEAVLQNGSALDLFFNRKQEDVKYYDKDTSFCPISSSRVIWETLQFCSEKQEMGAVVADAGMSKTTTILKYKDLNPGTLLITSSIEKQSLRAVMNQVLSTMDEGSKGLLNDERMEKIIDLLNDRTWNKLIIIDESHFLSWSCFELLRFVYDNCQIGITFLGMPKLLSQMRNSKGRSWDQIFSRIGIARTISTVERDDVKMIADSMCPGLPKNCINFLYETALEPGRLRVMAKLLKRTSEVAEIENTTVNLNLLKEVKSVLLI